MNLPILYSFRRCPYAMRARLALLASGLRSGVDYEHREVVLRDKPAELLAASPKGTVPVLVLPNGEEMGQVLDQSLDIMLWALRQNDPFNWLENEEEALKMIAQCDGDFKFHLDRYKYPNRYEGANALESRAEAAMFADSVNAFLQKIPQNKYQNQNQNQNQNQYQYQFNSSLGIYYAGCMSFLRQFANTDKAWFASQPWPALQTVLTSFETSNEFKTIMQTYSPWRPE